MINKMYNERAHHKEIDKNREKNFNSNSHYPPNLLQHINFNIIEMHLIIFDNFKRSLRILRRTLLVKSIEMESKMNINNINYYTTTIAEICDQIGKLVTSNKHMVASTVWIYHIKKIIDEIVNEEEKNKKNGNYNYLKSSLNFDKIKSNLVTYHENYICEIKTSRSNLNIKNGQNKNKEEVEFSNLLKDGLDVLISKAQNALSTINNSSKLEELVKIKMNY